MPRAVGAMREPIGGVEDSRNHHEEKDAVMIPATVKDSAESRNCHQREQGAAEFPSPRRKHCGACDDHEDDSKPFEEI
jgi:hypothetical protein